MINARAETLTEKPVFKDLVGSRRCIIPADGFCEWRKEGKRKVAMWVHVRTRTPFGLADLQHSSNRQRIEPTRGFSIVVSLDSLLPRKLPLQKQ